MDPASTEIGYATVSSELSRSDPLWLHRIFLGVTGVALAEAIFAIESGMKASIILSRPEERMFLDYFWYTGGVVAAALEWFSALYLLAAPENSDDRRARWTSPRKLLLIIGSTWAAVYLLSSFLDRIQGLHRILWFASSALHITAVVVLIYFLMRLAARTHDPFFARHFPLVLTLTLASLGLSLLIGISNYYDIPRALESRRKSRTRPRDRRQQLFLLHALSSAPPDCRGALAAAGAKRIARRSGRFTRHSGIVKVTYATGSVTQ